MLAALIVVVAVPALLWAVARWRLRGEDLSAYDAPPVERFASNAASAELSAVVASLGRLSGVLQGVPLRRRVQALRGYLDGLFPVDAVGQRIVPADADGVPAEWVVAPNGRGDRRLLYLHGGAFTIGSALSHRRLTTALAAATGAAVLAIDYRRMPEHPRRAGIDDCRRAYRWMLSHGPDGAGDAHCVWVAGDSAGGNLALSLIAWVRDAGLRQADAAYAMSPLTDAAMGSPSLRGNLDTDPMIGPLYRRLARLPDWLLLWFTWLQTRIVPCDPLVSPVRGDLSRLPPVLVQASEAEMLRDDARRWVARARAAGSPAHLQTWDHMVHVWQIYHPELAEGRDALQRAARFLLGTVPGHATDPGRAPEDLRPASDDGPSAGASCPSTTAVP